MSCFSGNVDKINVLQLSLINNPK